MPTVKLRLNDDENTLSSTSDLARFATRENITLLLKVGVGVLDQPVVNFAGRQAPGVVVEQDAEWSVGADTKVTIGFGTEAHGIVQIRKAGEEIMRYRLGEEEKEVRVVTVPAGQVCLSIGFIVTLNLEGGAEFSSGNLGVSAHGSLNNQYRLVNHKLFPAGTGLRTALQTAFEKFCLPFKPEGVEENLSDGEFVEYEFGGKLALGFGASYGVTKLLLAGRSKGEIRQAFESDLGKAVFTAKPAVKAGAEFAVNYEHTDAFRVVVGRKKVAGQNVVTLFLFRMDQSQLSVGFEAGVTVTAGLKFTLKSKVDDLIDKSANDLFGNLPKTARALAIRAFKETLNSAAGKKELDKYIAQVNQEIKKILAPTTQKTALTAKFEKISTETALFHYEFDFASAGAKTGFSQAMRGDFVSAIANPGVALMEGSYVERMFVRRTSIGFQFFDLYKVTSLTEYFQKTTLTYAGSGLFKFRFKTGVEQATKFLGSSASAEVFFSADALTNAGTTQFEDVAVHLNFNTADEKNQKSARQTAGALEAISSNLQAAAEAIRQAVTANPNVTVRVGCTFAKEVFGRIQSDDFVAGRPKPLVEQIRDASNWNAFVRAVERIPGQGLGTEGFPDLAQQYTGWALYNKVANGRMGVSQAPDRTHSGNTNPSSVWPSQWIDVDVSKRFMIVSYLEAGRCFMNLCDSLRHLVDDLDETQTEEHFVKLMENLSGIIKQKIPVFFIKSVLVALFSVTRSAPTNIEVDTVTDENLEISFEGAAAAVTTA